MENEDSFVALSYYHIPNYCNRVSYEPTENSATPDGGRILLRLAMGKAQSVLE